jgi:acyl-[acyl-carrier-protein] desaturase
VLFGRDAAWGEWVHRWTAEEGRHGAAIRDYLLVKRAVDPIELERAANGPHGAGYTQRQQRELMGSIAYVSFQELATRVSHRNTGRVTGDPVCDMLLARIAADENLHMIFYRNLLKAALELAPDQAMRPSLTS